MKALRGAAGLCVACLALTAAQDGGAVREAPVFQSPYVRIYMPRGDVFAGPGVRAKAGTFYQHWIPNDHTFIKSQADGKWHIFGITRPSDSGEIPRDLVHADEVQSLHAVSPTDQFLSSMKPDSWLDLPKVLGPASRPGQPPAFYAPHVVRFRDVYHMFWGPGTIWHATSTDLMHWGPKGAAFPETNEARDPNVQFTDGLYRMYYCKGNGISLRTSSDLEHWSDPPSELLRLARGSMESPLVVSHRGYYYLFWTIYDGTNTAYDWRTYVVRSKTTAGFGSGEKLGMILAHAPEWIEGEGGRSYLSTVEWPVRGISVAAIQWEKGDRFPVVYHAIPGSIETVNYDNGGEGVAYHAGRPASGSHPYRPEERVDIERCGEKTYDTAALRAGDWLEYTVTAAQTRPYKLEVTLGANPGSGTFHLEVNGRDQTGPIRVPANARSHEVITGPRVALRAGRQRLRLVVDSGRSADRPASVALHALRFR